MSRTTTLDANVFRTSAFPRATFSSTSNFDSNFNDSFNRASNAISTAQKVGIGIGVTFAILFVVFAIAIFIMIHKRNSRRRQQVEEDRKRAIEFGNAGGYGNSGVTNGYGYGNAHINGNSAQQMSYNNNVGSKPELYSSNGGGLRQGNQAFGYGAGSTELGSAGNGRYEADGGPLQGQKVLEMQHTGVTQRSELSGGEGVRSELSAGNEISHEKSGHGGGGGGGHSA